ncbi:MAG: ATP-binding protein [Oscillospiraceae bacterium]
MSNEIKNGSIPTLSIGKTVEILGNMYVKSVCSGIPFKKLPSVMLWGPPGVGKSQGIRQMAEYISAETGKKAVITDVRLLLFNPIDLRGIPTANDDKTLAVWLKPQIFQMDSSNDIINILFLDEITAAPQSVQAAAYQITLDRVIGEHKLPDNCIVIAAGNRVTDRSVAYKMPKALANRMLHIEIEDNFSSWKEWAVDCGVDPMVIGFLDFKREYLMQFSASPDDVAFATPRSWKMVSDLLNTINDDIDEMYPLIAGLVGTGTAIEFCSWYKVYHTLPSIEDIFDGKITEIPKQTDALYALISSMAYYASKHKDELKRIENSIEYAVRLPTDFTAALFKDYMYIEKDFRKKLLAMPVFSDWMSKKGSLLNGAV